MGLIEFLIAVVILGVFFYLIENYLPMSPPFKVVARVIAIVILLVLVLSVFGIIHAPLYK